MHSTQICSFLSRAAQTIESLALKACISHIMSDSSYLLVCTSVTTLTSLQAQGACRTWLTESFFRYQSFSQPLCTTTSRCDRQNDQTETVLASVLSTMMTIVDELANTQGIDRWYVKNNLLSLFDDIEIARKELNFGKGRPKKHITAETGDLELPFERGETKQNTAR